MVAVFLVTWKMEMEGLWFEASLGKKFRRPHLSQWLVCHFSYSKRIGEKKKKRIGGHWSRPA
jgi:hypothetical protein